ncbi:MAG TPA: hypothetical protein D7H82_03875, partial [Candidatus Poseidoniales archaeon]
FCVGISPLDTDLSCIESSSSWPNPGGGGGGGMWMPGGGGGGCSVMVGATCLNIERTWLCITVACHNL